MKKVILGLLLSIFSLNIVGQVKEAGYYDYKKLESAHPLNERLEDYLQQLRIHLEDSLNILQTNLQKYYEDEIPHQKRMDSLTRSKIESEINRFNETVRIYQNYAQWIYFSEENKMRNELKDKIGSVVREFRSKENLELLEEKEKFLACEGCRDYTEDIIKTMYSGAKCH